MRLWPALLCILAEPVLADNRLEQLLSLDLETLVNTPIQGATLTNHDLLSVPSSVTVYHQQQIQQLGANYLYELAALVPGFQVIRMGDTPYDYALSSRGRRIANVSAEILILVDGLRVDNARNASGFQILAQMPLNSIDKVEFIRGPGAAIYGSNAMMGVINISTVEGSKQISAGLGNHQQQRVDWQHHYSNKKLKLDWQFNYDSSEGETYSVESSFGPGQIKTQDPQQQLFSHIKLAYGNTRMAFLSNISRQDDFYFFERISDEFNYNDVNYYRLSAEHRLQHNKAQHDFSAAFSQTTGEAQTIFTSDGDFGPGSPAMEARIQGNSLSSQLRWRLNLELSDTQSLQSGLEYRHLDIRDGWAWSNYQLSDLAAGIIPPAYYGEQSKNTIIQGQMQQDIYGAYVQHQSLWFEHSQLVAGLRYDYFSGSGHKYSPRLTWVQHLSEQQSIKLLYNEAFRAPTAAERRIVNAPGISGNDQLEPENVKTLELSWQLSLAQHYLQFSIYENQFDNAILQITESNGNRVYANQDQDKSNGAEFEYSWQLSQAQQLSLNLSYLANKPEQSFRDADEFASFIWNLNKGRWNLNSSVIFQGERQLTSGEKTDNYTVFNAKLQYQLQTNWLLTLEGKNLADKQYYTPAHGLQPSTGVINQGRRVSIGLRYIY
ncbi:TonB-dependent receptor plug domain-containing protein [Agaribacterium haliotis]|uniref:TonB-dependent receptor plug domain-containing protein n=1 Tax=Agaribacterium haliotis TaxID=2013869 RepID=UPI0013041A5E|nr:TonB-dependent receptor [Agaribacterium haliotis]